MVTDRQLSDEADVPVHAVAVDGMLAVVAQIATSRASALTILTAEASGHRATAAQKTLG
jgi:hypothetical protein